MKHKISIVLPVWNEAVIINRTLDNIYSLERDGACEVIIVDGNRRGQTIDAIKRKEVKKIISEKGRAMQMNKGASIASGDILLFLHADTCLPEKALIRILEVMENGRFVGGAFNLGISSDRPVFRLIERAASFRSRITKMPYGDQAIFFKKEYFDSIGRFADIPLMEDVELMRRIKRAGGRICIIDEEVMTSPRRWEKEGIIRCTLRNWAISTLYFLGVSPERLTRFYRETN